MSVSDLAFDPLPIPGRVRDALARIPKAPAEGWLTVIALATLLIAMAWSVDDPGWIGGVGSRTDFLPTVALLGLAVGFIGAKVGWGRGRTHVIGALAAAIILPLIAGDIILGATVSGLGPHALWLRFAAAGDASFRAWYDLAILERPFTREWGHYVIAIGGLIWGTAQYAAYSVFGHRRPLDAVIAVGLVILANMGITTHDQLHLMVLASLGGLMLLSRSHAFEEKATWIRRRIGDPSAVTSLYLRGGSAFIAAAIVGSLTLTATASSKPLQSLWAGVPERVVSALDWLRKVLPPGGAGGGSIVVFSAQARAQGVWVSNEEIAFTADFNPAEKDAFRWRAGTWAEFDLNGWTFGDTQAGDHAANTKVLASTPEDPALLPARRPVTVEVRPDTFLQAVVLSPQTVQQVDHDTRLQMVSGSRWFVSLELGGAPNGYTVTALVPTVGDKDKGLTQNRLRVAGQDYPSSIKATYLGVPDGSLGPDAKALVEEIKTLAGNKSPYDKALLVETILKDSSRFQYSADVRGLQCDDISMVECFARFHKGYCQYYASTMAIILRELKIPTRLAQGFLPGKRDASGHEVVRNSGAHAWVEVYFPNYGWVDFDPTGGGHGLDAELPEGSVVPVTPKPSLVVSSFERPDESGARPSRSPGANPLGTTGPFGGSGPFVAIGILLVISMAGLVYIAWRRGPRRPMEPDVAWRGVLSIARRFGFGPRPAQTVFEYAGALGDEVPQVRPELQTVARGKVEVAYGQRLLGDDRKRAIAEASRRLRLGLLRLAFRRRRRGKGPRAI